MDAWVISVFFVLSTILFLKYPQVYFETKFVSEILDYAGFSSIVLGALFRMSARGYKKIYSKESQSLVTAGPYTVTRNPMYLGTFLIGLGMLLMLYPFWSALIYAVIFFLRFRTTIKKEEDYLSAQFGNAYQDYCARVPRFFPKPAGWMTINTIFSWEYGKLTQEKYGIILWPATGLALNFLFK